MGFLFGCSDRTFDAKVWNDANTTDKVRCQMTLDLKKKLEGADRKDVQKWVPKTDSEILVGICGLSFSFVGVGYFFLKIEYEGDHVKRVLLKKS